MRLETFTDDNSILDTIDNTLTSTLDVNTIQVGGEVVAGVSDVKADLSEIKDVSDAIKLRIDNLPQG